MISPTYLIFLQILILSFFNISVQTVEYFRIWNFTQNMNLPIYWPRFLLWIWPSLILMTFAFPEQAGWLLLVALLYHLTICVHFKGTFNGGSDYMTAYTLLGLTLMGFYADSKAGLIWIGTSLLISYFIAGAVKLKESSWRNGLALEQFFNFNRSKICPPLILKWNLQKGHFQILSWVVILAELLSPAVLWFPEAKLWLMAFFAFFHFLNFWVFGLNRFFWAWIASYPALFALPEL